MKKFFLIVGVTIFVFGGAYLGIRALTGKIYHSCTCYRFNIDNVEMRAHINIPYVDSVICDFDEIALVKSNVFYLSMDQNLKNYAKKNKFEMVTDSTYVHVGVEDDHRWDAKFNANTGRLDVVIDYINL
jgi:hypothetical protein